MKRLFVFVPGILLALFLLSSFVLNKANIVFKSVDGGKTWMASDEEAWMPVQPNFKINGLRNIFETADGTVFHSYNDGLYKSTDNGKHWKKVLKGMVMNIVESDGVLVTTGGKGIMQSTDNGENWNWIIREGGVGIAVERIKGGFAAITYNTSTESRRIHISLDHGKNWKAISDGLPPSTSISSIKQMGRYLICGHPDGIFQSSDMGKTWKIVHPPVDEAEKKEFKFVLPWDKREPEAGKVFKIFISGDVLYAMAVSSGC